MGDHEATSKQNTNRRTFLKTAAATGAALSVAGCVDALDRFRAGPEPTEFPEPEILDRTDETFNQFTHFGGFEAHVQDEVITKLSYRDHPFKPTTKTPGWRNRVYAPDRIKYPMKREGWEPGGDSDTSGRGSGNFERISWEEAIEIYASELTRIRDEYGDEAIMGGSYGWQSAASLHYCVQGLKRLLALDGGYVDQVDNYSLAATIRALPYTMGSSTFAVSSYQDVIDNTEVMVWWGANPSVCANQGYAGFRNEINTFLVETRDAGVEHIVIDPRYSETAKVTEAEHVPVIPGSDCALMAAIGYVLLDEDLYDEEFIDEYTVRFEPFREYLLGEDDGQPKTPEWSEQYTDVPASKVRELARKFANNRTLMNQGWAMQRGDFGEQPSRMMAAIAAMVGDYGLPGGGVTSRFHAAGGGGPVADFSGPGAIGVPANPVDEYIPCAKIADLLLNPGEEYEFDGMVREYPDIEAVFWAGGNPFSHHQDINKLIEAWRQPEFVAVNEIWWTPTAKHADLVLPAATPLERNDIIPTPSSVEATPAAIDPLFESKPDWFIFGDIAEELGIGLQYTEGRDEMEWIEQFYNMSEVPLDFEDFWEEGRYEFDAEDSGLPAYYAFRNDPESNPLPTPSGKIEIHSEQLEEYGYDDCPPTPKFIEPTEYLHSPKAQEYPLHIMNPHVKYRLHSQMDNVAFLRKWGKVNDKEPVWLNPQDAQERGIEEGDIVRVFNDRGAALAGAKISERVKPNTVWLSYGAWYDPEEPGEIGSLDLEGTQQMLAHDNHTSRLAQGPAPKSCLGDVELYEEA